MARNYDQLHGGNPPGPTFGQKVARVAHTVKRIYDVGSGIYHAAKFVAPLVGALL
jgi:hypothetical protein